MTDKDFPKWDLQDEDFFYHHEHINHVHFPFLKHHKTYEPWYDGHENFNTNAKSYYDYLARFNGFLYEMVNQVNRLLRRNIDVKNTLSIEMIKQGDWIDNGDCKTKFDDIERLYANLIVSKQTTKKTYSHINRKEVTYTLNNSLVVLNDGVYVPDYGSILDAIDSDLNQVHTDIDNLTQRMDHLEKRVDNIENDIKNLQNTVNNLGEDNKILKKIIQNLINSGAMDETGNFGNKNIAYGTINTFTKGDSSGFYIRTNKTTTDGDLLGGV